MKILKMQRQNVSRIQAAHCGCELPQEKFELHNLAGDLTFTFKDTLYKHYYLVDRQGDPASGFTQCHMCLLHGGGCPLPQFLKARYAVEVPCVECWCHQPSKLLRTQFSLPFDRK